VPTFGEIKIWSMHAVEVSVPGVPQTNVQEDLTDEMVELVYGADYISNWT
jgi:hypothetical protein